MNQGDRDFLELFSQKLEAENQGFRAEMRANHDIVDLVHQEVKKQNGRVKDIECDTSVWRMIQRNPFVSIPLGLFSLGVLIAIVDLIGVVNIFK